MLLSNVMRRWVAWSWSGRDWPPLPPLPDMPLLLLVTSNWSSNLLVGMVDCGAWVDCMDTTAGGPTITGNSTQAWGARLLLLLWTKSVALLALLPLPRTLLAVAAVWLSWATMVMVVSLCCDALFIIGVSVEGESIDCNPDPDSDPDCDTDCDPNTLSKSTFAAANSLSSPAAWQAWVINHIGG